MESKIIFRMIKTETYHTYQRIIIIYHNIYTKYKIIIRPYFVLSPFLSNLVGFEFRNLKILNSFLEISNFIYFHSLGFLEKSSCARTMKILTFYVKKFISSSRQTIYGNNIQTYNPKITI